MFEKRLFRDMIEKNYYDKYYLNTSDWITNETKYLSDKTLHEKQKDLLDKTHDMKLTFVHKSRQAGVSTGIVGLMAHNVFFGIIPSVIFISMSKQHAIELMNKFYRCMDSITSVDIDSIYIKRTKLECEFINGYKVVSLSSNPKTMVGFTGCVVWDDADRFDEPLSKEIWENVIPCISTSDSRMYVIGTGYKHSFFNNLIENWPDIIIEPKKLIEVHCEDVPHLKKQIPFLKSCIPESTWKTQYELEIL